MNKKLHGTGRLITIFRRAARRALLPVGLVCVGIGAGIAPPVAYAQEVTYSVSGVIATLDKYNSTNKSNPLLSVVNGQPFCVAFTLPKSGATTVKRVKVRLGTTYEFEPQTSQIQLVQGVDSKGKPRVEVRTASTFDPANRANEPANPFHKVGVSDNHAAGRELVFEYRMSYQDSGATVKGKVGSYGRGC